MPMNTMHFLNRVADARRLGEQLMVSRNRIRKFSLDENTCLFGGFFRTVNLFFNDSQLSPAIHLQLLVAGGLISRIN